MNFYLLLPLVACISSAMLSAVILVRGDGQRTNRVGAVLTAGAAILYLTRARPTLTVMTK